MLQGAAGHPSGLVPRGVDPCWRHLAQPLRFGSVGGTWQMLLAAGMILEPAQKSLPSLSMPPRAACSCPPSPPRYSRKQELEGFMLLKDAGAEAGSVTWGVGSSLRHGADLFRVLVKACLPPSQSLRGFASPPASEHPGYSLPSASLSPHLPAQHFPPLRRCLSNTNRLSPVCDLHFQRLLCWKSSGDGELHGALSSFLPPSPGTAELCWGRAGTWCRANGFSK